VDHNIKTNLKEIWCEDLDWIHLAQDRDQWRVLVNMVINFRIPIKGREFFEQLRDY
jgi:hypothetical protein